MAGIGHRRSRTNRFQTWHTPGLPQPERDDRLPPVIRTRGLEYSIHHSEHQNSISRQYAFVLFIYVYIYLFTNEPSGDVLHEKREEDSEPSALLTKQVCGGDASRIHGREGDSRGLVEPLVEQTNSHHVANLGVFV